MLATMMDNGATVADWLGTAQVAASLAASNLYDAQRNTDDTRESSLRAAADYAAQSLDEICSVMDRLGFLHGYGMPCTFGTPDEETTDIGRKS